MTQEEGNKLIAEFMGCEPINWNASHQRIDYDNSWNFLMPVVEKIRRFKDPFKADDSYVFGNMSVHISDAYPRGWNCHILGTLTRFTKLSTGMHDYKELPEYNNSIRSEKDEDFITPVWQAVVQFIQWYNNQKSKP
jgi:hypothetical protein